MHLKQKVVVSIKVYFRNIRNVLTDYSAAQLIHALISSRINYCNSILYWMSDFVISDLQHIQTTAARILAKCSSSYIHSKVILKPFSPRDVFIRTWLKDTFFIDYILFISSDGLALSIECVAHLKSLLNTRGHLYYVLPWQNER